MAASNYGDDADGDLTTLTDTAQGSTIAGYSWAYNDENEVTSFGNSQHSAENLTYGYDAAGQLTGVNAVNNSSASESYSYDSDGNRVSSSAGSTTDSGYVTGANNLVVSDGTYNYQYDAEGNRIEKTNISTGAYTVYTYDYRQELTGATSSTNAGAVTQTVAYSYDAEGRQILGDGHGGRNDHRNQVRLRRPEHRRDARRHECPDEPLPGRPRRGPGFCRRAIHTDLIRPDAYVGRHGDLAAGGQRGDRPRSGRV